MNMGFYGVLSNEIKLQYKLKIENKNEFNLYFKGKLSIKNTRY